MKRILLVLAVMAVGCQALPPGAHAAPPPPPAVSAIRTGRHTPNLLVVTRYNHLPMDAPTPYSSDLHRVGGARDIVPRLYDTVCTLAPVDLTPPPSCGADMGIGYTLRFRHNAKVVLQAAARPTGCQWLFVGTGSAVNRPYWLTSWFWKLLGEGLHIKPRLLHTSI